MGLNHFLIKIEGRRLAVPAAASDIEGHTYAEWNPSSSGTGKSTLSIQFNTCVTSCPETVTGVAKRAFSAWFREHL